MTIVVREEGKKEKDERMYSAAAGIGLNGPCGSHTAQDML